MAGFKVTVDENVTDVSVVDDVTLVNVSETVTVLSESVAGVQGPSGTNGTNGTNGATGPAGIIANTSIALEPELLIVGSITRNSSNVLTSAAVVWPDAVSGTYTSLTFDSTTGAVNSYQITKGSAIYTQPTLTRNSDGAVTNRPGIVVT